MEALGAKQVKGAKFRQSAKLIPPPSPVFVALPMSRSRQSNVAHSPRGATMKARASVAYMAVGHLASSGHNRAKCGTTCDLFYEK